MEGRKRPLFIIITIAAKVTDRTLRSLKWGVVKGRTCREEQTGQVTRLWPSRYSMPCTSYSVWSWGITKVALSWSMASFWKGPCSLFYLLSLSRFWSLYSWVQFPSTAESSLGLPGAVWQLLAGHQHPSIQLQETQYWFCIFCIISLIINIISIITVISKKVICNL